MAVSAGMSFENIHLRLEAVLERELKLSHSHVRIVGTSSLTAVGALLCNTLSKTINKLPHLVVVSSSAEAQRFAQVLSFFDSSKRIIYLPHFEVSPYIGLYPNPRSVADRLSFLYAAQNCKPGDIFVASVGGLIQKTIPFSVLSKKSFKFRPDDDLPEDINSFLNSLGYQATPMVEDVGQYSMRGGILDVFSPAHELPVRIELFGDAVSSIRTFSPVDQKSQEPLKIFNLIPCREVLFEESRVEKLVSLFLKSLEGRQVDPGDKEENLRSLTRSTYFPGADFLLPFFYDSLDSPLDHFSSSVNVWVVDPMELNRHSDQIVAELKSDYSVSTRQLIHPLIESLYLQFESLQWPADSNVLEFANIDPTVFEDSPENSLEQQKFYKIEYSSANILELSNLLTSHLPGSEPWLNHLNQKLSHWKNEDYLVFIAVKNKSQAERIRLFLENIGWDSTYRDSNYYQWDTLLTEQRRLKKHIHIINRYLPESIRLPEDRLIFLKDEDLFGKKQRARQASGAEQFEKQAKRLAFGELKPGDCVVHIQHGIGVYEGLKIMSIGGVDNEFIQLAYKDKDKLYLPVYRVGQLQKYSGSAAIANLDKLGGTGWEKTKTKIRGHLKDVAEELLRLYARRAEMSRPPIAINENDFAAFASSFPFDETDDQLRAINDVVHDFTHNKPMDRLICGDVGFGKTEIAMRAAFLAAHEKKQVAVLAPTTVLSFQHFENFKKRFQNWNFEIRELNRFVSAADVKKNLKDLKEGKVDIIIGTHRLLSKDVSFKNLGLLIIDEEQKFGVTHKERIKKLKTEVDTLTMSATPIPRTLNMSLMGIRDLSIINTAPVDRLPTRTFISKWDDEAIRKAILAEIGRGGQVYFIHNRVQSIYGLADEIRQLVPEARIRVGHGQMDEDELEKTMVAFFNHEIDVLICTTIVESGMDIPRANTMFIDQAHMMGLSQLYQLRGRVGRSKQRAYCYLILPRNKKIDKEGQERLRVLQENSALGSGIRIAQYDLELRGTGDLLGEEQSGHINAIGYELFMDLLNEAVQTLRGEPIDDRAVDPEINLKIPAFIPDSYIQDIRIRLSYYKALSDVKAQEDIDLIESELKDQFGEIPEPTINLMGIMLLRAQCKELGIKDLSAGLKNISLIFSEKTRLKTETVIGLAMRENKKYSLTPDNRLNIRMNNITWPAAFEELSYLIKLI